MIITTIVTVNNIRPIFAIIIVISNIPEFLGIFKYPDYHNLCGVIDGHMSSRVVKRN